MIANTTHPKLLLKPGLRKKVTLPVQDIKPRIIKQPSANAAYNVYTPPSNLGIENLAQMNLNKPTSVGKKLKIMNLNVVPKRNNVNIFVNANNNAWQTPKNILGICHIGSANTFVKMEKYIHNLLNINAAYVNYSITIIAALISTLSAEFVTYIKLKYPQIIFIETPNAGFDIGSFFHILKYCKENKLEFDYVIKVHTKSIDEWREQMLNSIAGSTNCIHHILKTFEEPTIGLICDGTMECINDGSPANKNYAHLKYLIEKFNINISPNANVRFAGGTMFWVRYSILKKIFWGYDFNNILEEFNSLDTFDWNWYKFANRHTIAAREINAMNNKEDAHKHYLQYGKPNNLSPNLFHAIKYNTRSEKLRDGMIEHAYERFFSYMVVSLNYTQYFTISE
jgi:hypothetical protein